MHRHPIGDRILTDLHVALAVPDVDVGQGIAPVEGIPTEYDRIHVGIPTAVVFDINNFKILAVVETARENIISLIVRLGKIDIRSYDLLVSRESVAVIKHKYLGRKPVVCESVVQGCARDSLRTCLVDRLIRDSPVLVLGRDSRLPLHRPLRQHVPLLVHLTVEIGGRHVSIHSTRRNARALLPHVADAEVMLSVKDIQVVIKNKRRRIPVRYALRKNGIPHQLVKIFPTGQFFHLKGVNARACMNDHKIHSASCAEVIEPVYSPLVPAVRVKSQRGSNAAETRKGLHRRTLLALVVAPHVHRVSKAVSCNHLGVARCVKSTEVTVVRRVSIRHVTSSLLL